MKNGTFDLVTWNNDYARRYIASTVLHSLYLVLGVCGNLTAIIIYTTKMNSKHDDRYFIPFLASVDLAGCIVSTTFMLITNNHPYSYPNTAICKLLHFSASGLIVESIFLLFVISVQRYQKICRPFGFQMNLRCKRIVAILVSLLAIALAFPSIFLYERIEVVHLSTNVTGHGCGPVPNTDTFAAIHRIVFMVFEFISIICMSIFYGCVGYTLMTKLNPARKEPRVNQKSGREKGMTNGKKYSLMFMFISLVSTLCFFPPWIFILLETNDKTFWIHLSYEETQFFVILRGVFVLNFVVNPFIYCFFDSKFRQNAFKYCPWKIKES